MSEHRDPTARDLMVLAGQAARFCHDPAWTECEVPIVVEVGGRRFPVRQITADAFSGIVLRLVPPAPITAKEIEACLAAGQDGDDKEEAA